MSIFRRLFGRAKNSSGPLTSDQAEDLWQEAFDLFKGNQKQGHVKAVQIASRLIEDGPNDAVTRSKLQCFIADIYSQKLDAHDKAIEYYKEALNNDPGNDLAGCNLGFVYLKYKKDYESAVRILQQTLDCGASAGVRINASDWLAEAKQKLGR